MDTVTFGWKDAAFLVGMVACLLLTVAFSEVTLHEERSEAVVTLVDQDRRDPSLYRWVLVVGLDGTWSTLLDRENGRVLQCVGKARTQEIKWVDGRPMLRLGECVTVWEGIVRPKK